MSNVIEEVKARLRVRITLELEGTFETTPDLLEQEAVAECRSQGEVVDREVTVLETLTAERG